MINKFVSLIYLYFIFSVACFADGFVPIVSNVNPDIKEVGLQNWSITQNRSGEIFIGNNQGILSFDGYHWEKIELNDNEVARSLLAVDDRLYVGSCNSFGFFERDLYGKWKYTSLSAKLPKEKHFEDYDIWSIHQVHDKIYFQSFNAFFVYDGQETVTASVDQSNLPLFFHQVGDKLYVQLVNSDFCELVNDNYRTLLKGSFNTLGNVIAVLPYKDKLLLCTEWKGLFVFDGLSVTPFKTAIDNELCQGQINRAVYVPDRNMIVLGTIMNGVYCIDLNGKVLENYNMSQGLSSNTVLSLFCDNDDNVWIGLDVGLALVYSGTPYSVLRPSGKHSSIGMAFDVKRKDSSLYIATNQRVWNYNLSTGVLNPILGTEGQNWFVASYDNLLLTGNNYGLKSIVDNTSTTLQVKVGSTALKECRIHNQKLLLESSYTRLHIYKWESNTWQWSNPIEGFNAPIRNFEVDNGGVIWASHMNRGLFRIELNNDLSKVRSVKYYSSLSKLDANDGEMIQVMKIRGRIVFSNRHHLYTYDDMAQKIVSFDQLDKVIGMGIISATMVDDDHFWLADVGGYTFVEYKDGQYRQIVHITGDWFGSVCNENSNRVVFDGGYAYFCMNNCIGRYNMNQSIPCRTDSLVLREAYSETIDRTRIFLRVRSDQETVIVDNNIHLRFSYPNLNHKNVRFEFTLEGERTPVVVSDEPVISFSNLRYGNYLLRAVAVDINGNVLASVDYTFKNAKPFYFSYFAILFYILIFILIVVLVSRYNANRLLRKKKKEFEEEKMKQELKMLEQEKIIAHQQQKLLEAELSNKSHKLATMALDAAALSSNIATLKEVLTAQLQKSPDKTNVRSVMKLINSEISDEDFWKVYHQNFDLIHKNFFRNLRGRYPSLTSVDLKFCALLRLNLSTKDIANFTSLTVRGVETARYRIRKKLNVPEGQNLVDFLIDLENEGPLE